ncbi:MAG TPA: hypothetical protein VLA06_08170 [Woeseiaceae bacterium]|nr:hypothetical protein [Woeseiaceae bacterium]
MPAQQPDASMLEDQLLADARALLQAGRREIIADELRLTDAEAEDFWPVYDAYHAAVMEVRDRQAEVIGVYLKRYRAGDVSEDYAEDLLEQGLDVKQDLLKVQDRYLKRFKKTLPIRKLVRFYQLENKMDAEIDAQLAILVPLMDPV